MDKSEVLAYLGLVEAYISYLNVDKRDIAREALRQARRLIETQADHIRQLEAASAIAESLPGGEPEEGEQSIPF